MKSSRSRLLSRLKILGLALLLSLGKTATAATPENPPLSQDYISCAIITSEHLTSLQLYQRGVPVDLALESLPNIKGEAKKRVHYLYSLAKKIGILNTYADINTNFARCATLAYQQQGQPAADQVEYGYYFCAGENKIRYEIILYTDRYMDLDRVLKKTPDTHFKVAIDYYKLIEQKGILAAFDLTANNLKSCLVGLQ